MNKFKLSWLTPFAVNQEIEPTALKGRRVNQLQVWKRRAYSYDSTNGTAVDHYLNFRVGLIFIFWIACENTWPFCSWRRLIFDSLGSQKSKPTHTAWSLPVPVPFWNWRRLIFDSLGSQKSKPTHTAWSLPEPKTFKSCLYLGLVHSSLSGLLVQSLGSLQRESTNSIGICSLPGRALV